MNRVLQIALALLSVVTLGSCADDKEVAPKSGRSVQYFPNMYESVGYETYQEGQVFKGNKEAQKPVDGTISRGWMPYEYTDDNAGYESAKAGLNNPLPYTEKNLLKGAALYTIYCGICHGEKGDGKGHLNKTEKILGVPAYNDAGRAITQGSIYHVMYYGINNMGSYASQVNETERWQIAHHVSLLKNELDKLPPRAFDIEGARMVNDSLIVVPAADVNADQKNKSN